MTTFKSQATQKSERKEFVPVRAQNIGGSRHAETFLAGFGRLFQSPSEGRARAPGSFKKGEKKEYSILY